MHAIYISLIASAALTELAVALSPERGREQIKRIAALVVLLAILAPVRGFWESRDKIAGELADLLEPDTSAADTSDYAQTAEFLFTYAESTLGVGREGMTVTFQVHEEGRASGIVLHAGPCPYNLRRACEEELTRTLGVPVWVSTEEVTYK